MQDASFKIFNASAGSGKTFTLAKTYIKILLLSKNYDQFKYILAITFTNKAVGEMKARIIDMLKQFSDDISLTEPHPMFSIICSELLMSPTHLKNKSKLILKYIMHNYGAFDISTIDGFTHRIIRTFAYDLKLPVNFEVELDQNRMLNEAVERLISKAGSDKTLTNTLIDFAIEKADDDKSWDISYDFNKIAKLLVNENDLPALESLKHKTIEDFKALKKLLLSDIIALENKVVEIANDVLSLIDECGLQFDDFNRKSLPNHFKNISQKNFYIKFDSSWQNDLIAGNVLYPKRVTDDIASTINSIQPTLIDAFLKTKKSVFEIKLKKGFHKNIVPLSVLNAIQNELNALKEEQNKILISEFNKIISQEIKDQPTPFIYERLGEKFRHYFIDEFQDTSKMQWENLVKLSDNALSSTNGSLMLVGDAKQAIYRWRGGEPEQFINLYNKSSNPFQIEAEVLSLDTNYRSSREIINFNNKFFEFLSENYFSNSIYSDLYKHAKQHNQIDRDGYINIEFLEISKEDDDNEMYSREVYKTIEKCKSYGYREQDICVIVRYRKQGIAVANYLSERGVTITSSETLLLNNSDKVQFVNAFLKFLLQPNNQNLKIEILSFLADLLNVDDKHAFFSTYIELDEEDMFKGLESYGVFLNKNTLLGLPLYELTEELIRCFNLHNSSDAFLQFYLDIVLDFTQRQNSDLAAFVQYFEKKKDDLSVVSPKNSTAVQIMTIHKSKGLEFPVVIFPYADLNIYKELEPKVWFPVNKEDYNDFNTLLLNYNKDIEEFGEIGAHLYHVHQSQLELDNINLLYVTLTRAVDQLYIISKKDISSKGVVNNKTYAGMLIAYLQNLSLWSDNTSTYSFGKIRVNEDENEQETKSNFLNLISVKKEDHNLKILTKAGQLWDTKQEKAIERGNLVHLLLSKIKTYQDVDFVFDEFLASGEINNEAIEALRTTVKEVVQHKKLKSYFTNDDKIYNERDIITTTGEQLRPDRINLNSDNKVTIMDYKTGEKKLGYIAQIEKYAAVLESMNYQIKHKYIVYINDTVEVVEI